MDLFKVYCKSPDGTIESVVKAESPEEAKQMLEHKGKTVVSVLRIKDNTTFCENFERIDS